MRTLITGYNGFLGSNLARHVTPCDDHSKVVGLVREQNHKTQTKRKFNTVIYGDILDIELLKRIISDYEISTIYHLAAQSIVKIAHANPANTFASNITGTINVLEAVRQVNPKCKVVIASSDKAYGVQDTLPYVETMDVRPDGPYATSKACADLIAQSYHKEYGLNINIVRCANIYGPDLNMSRIIPNTITRILRGEKPEIYGNVLHYKREMIHVDDVCRAYQIIAEKGVPGDIYNIGDDDVITVNSLIIMICELLGYEGNVQHLEKDFIEIPFQYLSADKLKALGWEKKIGIQEGLKKTIDWYAARLRN